MAEHTINPPSDSAGWRPEQIRGLLLIALTAAGFYVCYRLAEPFLPALTWAVALAILFMPLHLWVERRIRRPNVAALLSLFCIAVLILAPAAFMAHHLISSAAHGAESLRQSIDLGDWQATFRQSPRFAEVEKWVEQLLDLRDAAGGLAAKLTGWTGLFVKGSMLQFAQACLTFYILFFLLRDRNRVMSSLRRRMPLAPEEWRHLVSHTLDTVHATVYGTLTVSVVQGALGGLMFWWLGLSAPLLWGTIMALLAVLRVVGAFIVWIPAAVMLAASGEWMKALILAGWGTVVVGFVDNLLYPILVGNRLKMHTLLAFVSAFGGLVALGPSGLVLGPVALTLTICLLDIWHVRNQKPAARHSLGSGVRSER